MPGITSGCRFGSFQTAKQSRHLGLALQNWATTIPGGNFITAG